MKARALSIASAIFVVGFALLGFGSAQADRGTGGQCTGKVAKAFKGQIIVSRGPLKGGDSDAATIAAYKAQRLEKVDGEDNGDDVMQWSFHYTGFLKKKGFSQLSLQFYVGDDYKADQRLSGIDTALTILESDVTLTEDDGLSKNKDYTLKLVGLKGNSETVLATTKVRLE